MSHLQTFDPNRLYSDQEIALIDQESGTGRDLYWKILRHQRNNQYLKKKSDIISAAERYAEEAGADLIPVNGRGDCVIISWLVCMCSEEELRRRMLQNDSSSNMYCFSEMEILSARNRLVDYMIATEHITHWSIYITEHIEYYRKPHTYLEFTHLVAIARLEAIGLRAVICAAENKFSDYKPNCSNARSDKTLYVLWFTVWDHCDTLVAAPLSSNHRSDPFAESDTKHDDDNKTEDRDNGINCNTVSVARVV